MREGKITKREMVEAVMDFAKRKATLEAQKLTNGMQSKLVKSIEGNPDRTFLRCIHYAYLLGFMDAFHIGMEEARAATVGETPQEDMPF